MLSLKSPYVVMTIAAICLMISAVLSGCDFTIGPRQRTVYTMVYPGRPLVILESKTVKARLVGDTGASYAYVKQDVGGWYVMPKAHYERLAKAAGIIGDESGSK